MSAPSLFDAVEGNTVRKIHESMEESNADWLARVRNGFAFHHAGREVTTDDVWTYLDAHDIALPADSSPNLLGSFFSGWDRARAADRFVRSKRKGANANLLRCWRLT